MPRIIITLPDLSGGALGALKEWLAITTAQEDALLVRLLASAHETCERFTGLVPLLCTLREEFAPAVSLALAARPVRGVTGVNVIAPTGTATPIASGAWSQAIGADGSALVSLAAPPAEGRIAVTFTAGIAGSWAEVPPALADGIVRLAAHAYRARGDVAAEPPAAVAALWRAWRRLRL
ncbi:head-tail connector protein [Qipengyuania sediminis]|uniref:head-tail connector protein n=1 Tax=Qipengyuania sediminis TaxID=1532023 RepID=UPI00105A436F|nr:hypothetical protein [Qipengyuania sediminis]